MFEFFLKVRQSSKVENKGGLILYRLKTFRRKSFSMWCNHKAIKWEMKLPSFSYFTHFLTHILMSWMFDFLSPIGSWSIKTVWIRLVNTVWEVVHLNWSIIHIIGLHCLVYHLMCWLITHVIQNNVMKLMCIFWDVMVVTSMMRLTALWSSKISINRVRL